MRLKSHRLSRNRISTGILETFPRAVTPRNTPANIDNRTLLVELEISIRNRRVAKNQMSETP
jgi:hypothetical protein